ncbi:hypothetical protein COY59_05615 [Candidatus Gottesmanbacteria bacterium CG_4_10_14_0_8_um_filter_37_24]|uniref:Uncharacterized protein n=1 Tax=Candidatus Gottesmanbacteria bacterium CG_4_10_14_0_8_um_filter_37_24 TaxID=1974574 RepID=A0A2M7RPM6_9BACT|nr:MAG: hypothetical protein COX23_03235 [Candidatus Gottesmanbacteria bacterium CG23_combo_of_CG06-09_8_20_14_all_37_19]PIZ02277.1 MAG: hypothetical protein COY59_05615 [Candidatus Gottesmanbacteria bacterium CG_4_10_14_0_8_um_filter_37_24]
MFYLGRFYFSKKELFLLIAGIALIVMLKSGYSLPYFKTDYLLALTLLTFIVKGFIPTTHDSPLLITFLTSLALTIYFPFFQIIIFYFLSFLFLKMFRVI